MTKAKQMNGGELVETFFFGRATASDKTNVFLHQVWITADLQHANDTVVFGLPDHYL